MAERCIIYGGAGFIGSHIADELIKKGFKVTIFDKVNTSKKNVEHLIDEIDFIEGDFNNKVNIRNSLKNIDHVVHLVSSTIPADSNLNPVYDVESNLVSSLNLFNECAAKKIKKIIFISSGGTVYGNPLKIPINEEHPTNPISSYGIIKLTIEKYLLMYYALYGLDYTILRFSNPFGERQNPHLAQGLIANLLYKIKQKIPIEIWGDGSVVRDYFYIRDGAEAVYKALTFNNKSKLFNISSNEGLSINEILEKFKKVLKLKFNVNYQNSRKFDVKINILDNTKAFKELGWKPNTDFDDALKNTWNYILDHE